MVDLVLHFRKPADWAPSVSVHFWDTRPQANASTWPGVRMTAEDDDWFVHRLSGIEAASLVFNDATATRPAISRPTRPARHRRRVDRRVTPAGDAAPQRPRQRIARSRPSRVSGNIRSEKIWRVICVERV